MTAATASTAPVTAMAPTTGERIAGVVQRSGAVVVLAVLLVVASFAFPSFATTENLRNVALQSSFLAIVALGMTFVIITGGIDLSVGSVFALGGVLAAYGSQYGSAAALLLPLAGCGAIGILNGALVARAHMAPFIVTLATLLGVRGLVYAMTNEGANTLIVARDLAFTTAGQGKFLGVGLPVWIAIALVALGTLFLQRTRTGQWVFAVGGSEDAATLMGLPVARVKFTVYVLAALLAGFAGALNAARSSSGVTTVGIGLELDAISAVIIGGTLLTGGAGTTIGTLAGVLLLYVIQNIINQVGSLTGQVQQLVSGIFLAVVVVVQTLLSRKQRL